MTNDIAERVCKIGETTIRAIGTSRACSALPD